MATTDTRNVARVLSDAFIDTFPQEAMEVLETSPLADIVQLMKTQPPERASRILSRMSTAQATQVI